MSNRVHQSDRRNDASTVEEAMRSLFPPDVIANLEVIDGPERRHRDPDRRGPFAVLDS